MMQGEASAGGGALPGPSGKATDDGVPRFRRMIIILEHTGTEPLADAAQRRAEWEQARRAGRSEQITVRADGWRDSAGKLWAPNMLVDVDAPTSQVHAQTWICGEVTYLRGERGTGARLVLMPPRAFDPMYDPLVSFNWQADQAAAEAQKQLFRDTGTPPPSSDHGQA